MNVDMHNKLKEIIQSLKIWENHDLLWLPTTTSTNDDIKAIWHNDNFCPIIEVADTQTKGKGQYERKWASSSIGQCLMFSFSIDIKEFEFPVSMIAGIALAIALEELGVSKSDFWLKWPNDIWLNNKKLSGILTESTTINHGLRSVVGIGINILPLPDKSINAISLSEYNIHVTREEVLIAFLKAFDKIFHLSASKLSELWNNYASNFKKIKCKIQILNEPAFIATALGVSNDGSLMVEKTNGEKRKIISATLTPII